MKRVLTEQEVAHRWANQLQEDARNQRDTFYFNRDTIYSYGGHFPIAKLYKNVVLFTTRTYSNTTAKHIGYVRGAASHLNKIYCSEIPNSEKDTNAHEKNIAHWKYEIEQSLNKLIRAKKPEIYHQEIARTREELTKYIEFFGIKLKKSDSSMIFSDDIEGYKEGVKKAKEAENRKKLADEKKAKKLYAEYLPAWHDFKEKDWFKSLNGSLRSFRLPDEDTLLRTDGEKVFTSKGIELPINVAHRYYNFYMRIVAKGGCNGNCNYKMLEYNVTSMSNESLVIGCHNIPRSEINLLAAKLNWN